MPATVLGTIVRVRKSVLEHRQFVMDRWKEIQEGKIDPRQGKGIWGAVDADWLAEIVEGEGSADSKKEKRPRNGGRAEEAGTTEAKEIGGGRKKRKATDDEDDLDVYFVEGETEDEEPPPSRKGKQPVKNTSKTKSSKTQAEMDYESAMKDLLGDSYDVLSGNYEIVNKVAVSFDDRKGTGRVEPGWGVATLPKLKSLEEKTQSDDEDEEILVARPRIGHLSEL